MRLQKRDGELFKMVCDFGLLSTKQIGNLFFKEVAITTVLKRLRILEKEGFIKRVSGLESFELLWGISDKGARLIEQENYKTSWSKQLLEHDYKISSLRLSFLNFKLYESWVPEHEIRSLLYKKYSFKGSLNKLIPDGLMTIKRKGNVETWAMEIELSLKGKDRYERIFREYGKKENLSGIWYFVKGDSLFKSLKDSYKRYSYLLNGKVFVISYIDEVLSNLMEAKIFYPANVETLSQFLGIRSFQPAHVPAHTVSNLNLQKGVSKKILSSDFHTSISGTQN